MGILLNYPLFHADDGNGDPLVGGLLYTYIGGTTTNKATYTTRAMTVANDNPVVLNTRGEATVYGTGLYKLVLKTVDGVTIWTEDNVQSANHSTANTANPPTDADLNTAFGTPEAVGAGFVGTLDDAGGGANDYICWSDGTNWWYATGTKAT